MLEPWVRPRPAQFAYGGLLMVAVAAAFSSGVVVTRGGDVTFRILMPTVAAFLAVRLAGLTLAVMRGRHAMDWFSRVLSWGVFAFILFMLSLLTAVSGLLALALFVGADAAGALASRRPEEDDVEGPSPLEVFARNRWPLLGALYVLFVVAFHFLVAVQFTVGYLLDWVLIAFGFSLGLWIALSLPRAPERALRPPQPHRRHARVERVTMDPTQRTGDAAARAFLFDGDAEPLLALVRDVASYADSPPRDAKSLEERVRAALGRAGTTREQDLEAALAALETAFAPGGTPGVNRP